MGRGTMVSVDADHYSGDVDGDDNSGDYVDCDGGDGSSAFGEVFVKANDHTADADTAV